MNDPTQLSLVAQSAMLRRRELSPVDLLERYLQRIDEYNGRLHAYIHVFVESARRAARLAEAEIGQGTWRGPLHGMPIGIKDQIHTREAPTTCGSRVPVEPFADGDAAVVQKLRAAGAVIIGKHNLNEFGLAEPLQPAFGRPRNPWHLGRSVGGSSSGSAVAVAAGLCAAALGEDTGGSIRGPAAWTGTVGLRPTTGLVSRHGLVGVSWWRDVIGPMTRTVEDAAAVLSVIADGVSDDLARPLEPSGARRIGRVQPWGDVDAGVEAAVDTAARILTDLGHHLRGIGIPCAAHAAIASQVTSMVERAPLHDQRLRGQSPAYDRRTLVGLIAGSLIPARMYFKAMQVAAVVRKQVLAVLQEVDVLILPAQPCPAPPAAEWSQRDDVRQRMDAGSVEFLTPFSLAGVPAISVPCGFSTEGLPIGLQIVAGPGAEVTLLQIALAFQQATDWHLRRPTLAGH